MRTAAALQALTGQAAPAWNEGPLGEVAPMFRQAWDLAEQKRLAESDARLDEAAQMTLGLLQRRVASATEAGLETCALPAVARHDAWKFVKAAANAGDAGVNHLKTYLQRVWMDDPQGTLSVGDCVNLRRQYAACFPKSAAPNVLNEAVRKVGAMSVPLRELMQIAAQIRGATPEARQASYEECVRAYSLIGSQHDKVRARAFLRALAQAEAPQSPPLPESIGAPPAPLGEPTPEMGALHDEGAERAVQMVSPNTGLPLTLEVAPGVPPSPSGGMDAVAPVDQSMPVPPPNGAARGASAKAVTWRTDDGRTLFGERGQAAFVVAPSPLGGWALQANAGGAGWYGVGGFSTQADAQREAARFAQQLEAPEGPAPEAGSTDMVVPDPTSEGQNLRVELHSDPNASPMDGEPSMNPGAGGSLPLPTSDALGASAAFAVHAVSGGALSREPLEVIQVASIEQALARVAERLGGDADGARVLRRSPLIAYVELDAARGEGVRIAAALPGRAASELPEGARAAAAWLDQNGFYPTAVLCAVADRVLDGEDDADLVAIDFGSDLDGLKDALGASEIMGAEDGDASAEADAEALLEEAKAKLDELFSALKECLAKEGARDPRLAAVRTTAGASAGDVEAALLGGARVERQGIGICIEAGQVQVHGPEGLRAEHSMADLDYAIAEWQSHVALQLPPPSEVHAGDSASVHLVAELPDVAKARPELAQRIATAVGQVPGAEARVEGGRVMIVLADAGAAPRVRRVLADRFGVLEVAAAPTPAPTGVPVTAAPVTAAPVTAAPVTAAPVINSFGQPAQHSVPVMQPDLAQALVDRDPERDPATHGPAAPTAPNPPGMTPTAPQPRSAAVEDGEGTFRVAYRTPEGTRYHVNVLAADQDTALRLVATSLPGVQVEQAARVTPGVAPARVTVQAPSGVPGRRAQVAPVEVVPGEIAPIDGPGALPGAGASPPMIGLDAVQITDEDRAIIHAGMLHYRTLRRDIDEAVADFRKEYADFLEKFGKPGSVSRAAVGGIMIETAREVYRQASPIGPGAVVATRGRVAFPTPKSIKPDHPTPGLKAPPKLGDTSQAVPKALTPRVNKPGAGGAAVTPPKPALGKDHEGKEIGRFRAKMPRPDGRALFDGPGTGQSYSETKLPKDTEQNVPSALNSKMPKVR